MGAQCKAKGKGLAANARGRVFGKLAKEVMVAARNGADPASNARLRLVVEQARKVSMPKDTLDRPTALARAGIFPSTRGLLACHPVLIAAVLHRDFARNKDDATVVVIQGH